MAVIPEPREDVPQNTILGRKTAGSGDWEELTPKDLVKILYPGKAVGLGVLCYAGINGAAPTTAAGAIVANSLRAYPWDIDYPLTVNRLSAIITTAGAAGTQARVALYSSSPTIPQYPGDKIVETELLLNGTIITEQAVTFANLELFGRYWVVSNGSVALASRQIPAAALPQLGHAVNLTANSQRTGLSLGSTFASGLPAIFPGGASFSVNTPALLVALRTP
jgi:hypothetical protein